MGKGPGVKGDPGSKGTQDRKDETRGSKKSLGWMVFRGMSTLDNPTPEEPFPTLLLRVPLATGTSPVLPSTKTVGARLRE